MKILMKHIKMFSLTIVLIITMITVGLRLTVLNRGFIENQFSQEHYLRVEKNIKEEMKGSMLSSGIDSKVIDTMFTTSDVKETTNQVIDILYNYHNQSLNTDKIQNNLEKNIIENLNEHNYQVDNQEDYQSFVDSIMKIYKKEFTMLNHLEQAGKYMNTIIKMDTVLSIILSVFLLLLILLRFRQVKRLLPVPLLTTSFLTLFSIWYINKTAGLSSITIFSETFSSIIRLVIEKTFIIFQIISIVSIVLAILLHIFLIHEHRKHRKEA